MTPEAPNPYNPDDEIWNNPAPYIAFSKQPKEPKIKSPKMPKQEKWSIIRKMKRVPRTGK
jgi:hypothetical protein